MKLLLSLIIYYVILLYCYLELVSFLSITVFSVEKPFSNSDDKVDEHSLAMWATPEYIISCMEKDGLVRLPEIQTDNKGECRLVTTQRRKKIELTLHQ